MNICIYPYRRGYHKHAPRLRLKQTAPKSTSTHKSQGVFCSNTLSSPSPAPTHSIAGNRPRTPLHPSHPSSPETTCLTRLITTPEGFRTPVIEPNSLTTAWRCGRLRRRSTCSGVVQRSGAAQRRLTLSPRAPVVPAVPRCQLGCQGLHGAGLWQSLGVSVYGMEGRTAPKSSSWRSSPEHMKLLEAFS